MGLLCDYFTAASDELAASVVEPGPTGASMSPVADATPSAPGQVAVVDGCGVEPTVQMSALEALLTGSSYQDLLARGNRGRIVAQLHDGAVVVERLPDSLLEALADASHQQLADVAVPWSRTDEFWGQGVPDALAGLLEELSDLAKSARAKQQHLYCWVSL